MTNSSGMKIKVMMVAGEASADIHAAALMRELKSIYGNLFVFGAGGKGLREQGARIDVTAESLSIVGITGWWDKLGGALRSFRLLVNLAKKEKPDAAILLDLPDFNLMLARRLKRLGVPVIYYISPQVWAWRRYRIRKIKKNVDKMLVLFPFEKEFYDRYGVSSEFVGHPLVEQIKPRDFPRCSSEVRQAPRIALLPGSRTNEIEHHGAILKEVVKLMRKEFPLAEFRVPVAPTLEKAFVESYLSEEATSFCEASAQETLRWADIAVVASGTATLETALVGTPFCLFYRVNAINAWIWRALAKYKGFIGMPNLLLGRQVVKEFFQELAQPSLIATECIRLLNDSDYRASVILSLKECRMGLGSEGASRHAAESVKKFLETSQRSRGIQGGLVERTLQPA